LLKPGSSGVLCLIRTKVPNLLWLSSSMNFPFSSLILAWQRETEMSLMRRSLSWPLPSLNTSFYGDGRIMWMIRDVFFSWFKLSSTM
jgi:hypothetical protein